VAVQQHPWFAPLVEPCTTMKPLAPTSISLGDHSLKSAPLQKTIDWGLMRHPQQKVITPPFIPHLADAEDTQYFDDFSNPAEMELYKEVWEKQEKIQADMGEDEIDEGIDTRSNSAAKASRTTAAGPEGSMRSTASLLGSGKARSAFVGFTFRHRDAACLTPAEEEEVKQAVSTHNLGQSSGEGARKVYRRFGGFGGGKSEASGATMF
jgi:hypothetical protein